MHLQLIQKYLLVACASALTTISCLQASSLVVDNQTGIILQNNSQNHKLPIGSLAQLATSMVALDWAQVTQQNLSVSIQIPASAAFDRSIVGLQVGDEISLRDLIYCVVLVSDPIAATTLAKFIGSRIANPTKLSGKDNFVAQMNALARQIGMNRTLFLNPDGSELKRGKQSYSTAADIARLVRYSYAQPQFPFYADQTFRVITIHRMGEKHSIEIKNTNTLLGNDGIDGAKISFSPRAGGCLALTASRPSESKREGTRVIITPRRIITVLLGSTHSSEGTALLRQGWSLYEAWAASGRPTQEHGFL